MLSQKLINEINDQINYEFYSAHIYTAMAAYCSSQNLDGFANFFKVQVEEERFHAMKFYDYLNNMGGCVKLTGMDTPQNDYDSVLSVFKAALEHEKKVTSRIYHLMDTAIEEREHATMSFLKWFIDEQVEEESNFSNIIIKLQRIGMDTNALYLVDGELAQRQFIPPATNV